VNFWTRKKIGFVLFQRNGKYILQNETNEEFCFTVGKEDLDSKRIRFVQHDFLMY